MICVKFTGCQCVLITEGVTCHVLPGDSGSVSQDGRSLTPTPWTQPLLHVCETGSRLQLFTAESG